MRARTKPSSQDLYFIGRAYYFTENYAKADSSFIKLATAQPKLIVGEWWLARSKAAQDPESEKGLAKPYYEKLIEKATAGDVTKAKVELTEAYSYLGYYHYLKGDLKTSKPYWEKVLAIDPANEKAKTAVKSINELIKRGTAPKKTS